MPESALQSLVDQDMIYLPVSMPQAIIPHTLGSEADVANECMSQSIMSSEETIARYSDQQLNDIDQFPSTDSAIAYSTVQTQPLLDATSHTAYHQHSLNQYFGLPPVSMHPPMVSYYGAPMVHLPVPVVQPGQYYPITNEGQYASPYAYEYETVADMAMNDCDYKVAEMEPNARFGLIHDGSIVYYDTPAFQNEVTNEESYTVSDLEYDTTLVPFQAAAADEEIGYHGEFEPTAEYDPAAYEVVATDEEQYTVTEMEFYRDVPLTNDPLKSDHCHICDVNLNDAGNESHLLSQDHVNMEINYKEYQHIKSKYQTIVEEAETLISLTNGGNKSMLQHQINKISESKVNFGRIVSRVEENFSWQTGQKEIEKQGTELTELIKSYYAQVEASKLA